MKITSHPLSIIRAALQQTFPRAISRVAILAALAMPISSLLAQSGQFTGRDVTGSLEAVGTVNASELAKTPSTASVSRGGPEINPHQRALLRPPIENSGRVFSPVPSTPRAETGAAGAAPFFRGFTGLTQLDSRNARGGNQFTVEPPDQALSVGNGFVLEAVNEAFNVYDTNGVQQLSRPLALSEFFGLPAEIDRTTGVSGPSLTDPVSLFDPETNRWFVVIAAQLIKPNGTPLPKSRLFLAVSQTSDATGIYTIYTLNTTFMGDPDGAGARFPDFPHIGTDRYGFFISVNEFGFFTGFIDSAIFAISKQALITGSGGAHPGVTRIALPFQTGYEFTVFPANTPPGTHPFLGNGGAEFFVSGHFTRNTEHSVSVWALTNTSSLNTIPSLGLQRVRVNTQSYNLPSQAVEQKGGFHPLGASLNEPVPTLDPGDFRVLSVVYSSGRLWATLGTEVTDARGDQRMAAAFFAFSPNIVGGALHASLITQGVVSETGASLLRPAIAVNSQNKGGIVFTLVGPNDFPSSAFVAINDLTAGAIHISSAGQLPEDGFSGYPEFFGSSTARWGDYSAAAVDSDGSIWMATEYVTNLPRTSFANWDTFITRFQP